MISYREVVSSFLHWKTIFFSALNFHLWFLLPRPCTTRKKKAPKQLYSLEGFSLTALSHCIHNLAKSFFLFITIPEGLGTGCCEFFFKLCQMGSENIIKMISQTHNLLLHANKQAGYRFISENSLSRGSSSHFFSLS